MESKRNFYSCPACGSLTEIETGKILGSLKKPVLQCKSCLGIQEIPGLIFVEIIRGDLIKGSLVTAPGVITVVERTSPPGPTTQVEIFARGLTRIDPIHSLAFVNHSPDGFEYGYGGSGPAQLSFALLLHFLGVEAAGYYYQTFKDKIVSQLPRESDYVGLFFDRKIWEVE